MMKTPTKIAAGARKPMAARLKRGAGARASRLGRSSSTTGGATAGTIVLTAYDSLATVRGRCVFLELGCGGVDVGRIFQPCLQVGPLARPLGAAERRRRLIRHIEDEALRVGECLSGGLGDRVGIDRDIDLLIGRGEPALGGPH